MELKENKRTRIGRPNKIWIDKIVVKSRKRIDMTKDPII